MSNVNPFRESELEQEIAILRWQLSEANDTLEAIRTGQVDALIVKGADSHQIYSLKSADQTYRVFIENMREGAVTLSREAMILYSNNSFAEMVKQPLTSVMGASFYDFIPGPLIYFFKNIFEKAWEFEDRVEMSLLDKDHKLLPVLISLTTLELDEGLALSVIVTDLSLQKNAERQLQIKNEELANTRDALELLNTDLEEKVLGRTAELFASIESFKFLADNIPVIVWTAKPNGDIEYFNNKWYQYTGMNQNDGLGWSWEKALHPEDLPGTVKAWQHALNTGSDYAIEFRLLNNIDNTYRWHMGTARPFLNSNGSITQWFGICIDIESQKVALNEKDEFISMASHELKTPITILKAFTEILFTTLQAGNTEKATGFVSNIDKQVNRLDKLVTELLDATKANAGELTYEQDDIDFNVLVKEVASQIQLTSLTHTIEIQLGETHFIKGDRNRLSQVISNLISNAIKYSPGADTVMLTSDVQANRFRLCVKDSGIGIPVNEQPKLFTRFFRANEVKTNTFPGLGLGLYISNEIMKKHGGSLHFESNVGKGSTFCMLLPVDKQLQGEKA